MARVPDQRVKEAEKLFNEGWKLVAIAKELGISEGTVRSWKSRYKWDCNVAKDKCNVAKGKGGQPGNKNAEGHGAPKQNKNAEKYGFFSKYLPKETQEIFQAIELADPLELLWHQIQIAYAAIIRAQRIAYVEDRRDKTIEKVEEKKGNIIGEKWEEKKGNIIGEKWEVQQAWDKQNEFLKAQARAQSELRNMIKQYDEILHKNWELADEEQKTRIETMKVKAQLNDGETIEDDGFLEAISATAAEDWADEED